jgi:hypothetical protein
MAKLTFWEVISFRIKGKESPILLVKNDFWRILLMLFWNEKVDKPGLAVKSRAQCRLPAFLTFKDPSLRPCVVTV